MILSLRKTDVNNRASAWNGIKTFKDKKNAFFERLPFDGFPWTYDESLVCREEYMAMNDLMNDLINNLMNDLMNDLTTPITFMWFAAPFTSHEGEWPVPTIFMWFEWHGPIAFMWFEWPYEWPYDRQLRQSPSCDLPCHSHLMKVNGPCQPSSCDLPGHSPSWDMDEIFCVKSRNV